MTIPQLSRRQLLAASAAGAGSLMLHGIGALAGTGPVREYSFRAAPARVRLVPETYAETPVWSYNGSVPGPAIRVRQGDRLRISVENALAEETTVHWHGVRVPNAMDGVPHLTQRPIGPGETFLYEFDGTAGFINSG